MTRAIEFDEEEEIMVMVDVEKMNEKALMIVDYRRVVADLIYSKINNVQTLNNTYSACLFNENISRSVSANH